MAVCERPHSRGSASRVVVVGRESCGPRWNARGSAAAIIKLHVRLCIQRKVCFIKGARQVVMAAMGHAHAARPSAQGMAPATRRPWHVPCTARATLITPFSLPLALHLGPPLSRPTTTTQLAEPRGDGLSHTHATFQSTRTIAAPPTYNRARAAAGARIELHVRHMQRRAHGAEERRSGWGGAASKP